MFEMYEVLNMNQGKQRRDMIIAMLESGKHVLAVNCKYRPQLYQDNDLRLLIKKGVLRQVRQNRRTYLILNKKD